MKIDVTQEDIDLATNQRENDRNNDHYFMAAYFCPVARAIRKHYGWEEARVETEFVLVKNWQVSLPDIARRKIVDFDALRPITPFSFIINVGDEK